MIKTDRPTPKPYFSIVIPTLNEEKFLPRLLGDLKKQTFKDFEVIHIDGRSTDSTCQKAAEFHREISISCFTVNKRNVSYQRNTGGKKARGQWVIFMDADNRLKRTYLAQLQVRLETHPDTDVFTCLLDSSNASLVMKNLLDFCNLIMLTTAKVRPFAAGALIGIRRKHLKELKFNEAAKMSEDHQFVEEAVKKGLRYRVFSQPRYRFSLRRFEKEGSLKVIVDYVRGGVVLLAGPKFERFLPEYPMTGGTDYVAYAAERANKGIYGLLPSMRDIINTTTKTQQQKMRMMLSRIQSLMNDI